MPGELPEKTWMSDEMVSGIVPCCIAASATVKSKLPPPWPMSKITPRFFAASASGISFPSCTMLVNLPALFGAPEKQCVRMSPARSVLRISPIRLGVATPPMWHMMRAPPPAISQARIARLSGSMPAWLITFSDMRTFTPSAMSAFSATVLPATSGMAKPR